MEKLYIYYVIYTSCNEIFFYNLLKFYDWKIYPGHRILTNYFNYCRIFYQRNELLLWLEIDKYYIPLSMIFLT